MDKLPGVTFYHQATPLITKAVSEQTNQATQVLVDINNDFFDIVVTQFGKLKLHNAYLYQKEDDILYYILFVLKQSFLDPSKTPVLLSGDIDSNGSLIKLLEKYLPRLDFNQPDKSFTYSYKLNKVPEHTVFTLYNLIHCE